jgi:hypothetical protein
MSAHTCSAFDASLRSAPHPSCLQLCASLFTCWCCCPPCIRPHPSCQVAPAPEEEVEGVESREVDREVRLLLRTAMHEAAARIGGWSQIWSGCCSRAGRAPGTRALWRSVFLSTLALPLPPLCRLMPGPQLVGQHLCCRHHTPSCIKHPSRQARQQAGWSKHDAVWAHAVAHALINALHVWYHTQSLASCACAYRDIPSGRPV